MKIPLYMVYKNSTIATGYIPYLLTNNLQTYYNNAAQNKLQLENIL